MLVGLLQGWIANSSRSKMRIGTRMIVTTPPAGTVRHKCGAEDEESVGGLRGGGSVLLEWLARPIHYLL